MDFVTVVVFDCIVENPRQSTRVSAPEAKTSVRPSPTHVTLAVILQVREGALQVLLWQRAKEPDLGSWSLPGGYLDPGETLEESIRRHLAAKVDVREVAHVEQLATLSDPDRYPREWQLATAYLGLVPRDLDPALPEDTRWFPVAELPRMAFDHGDITLAGRERLRGKLSYTNAGFALAPQDSRSRSYGDLRRGARASGVVDESEAGAAAARRPRADRRGPQPGPGRWAAGTAFPVPLAAARDHGSVRGASASALATGSKSRFRSDPVRLPEVYKRSCGRRGDDHGPADAQPQHLARQHPLLRRGDGWAMPSRTSGRRSSRSTATASRSSLARA